MRNRRFALFGGLLILILFLLCGALRGTEFRSGRSLPVFDTGGLGAPSPGVPISGEWMVDLLRIVLFAGLLLAALALVISRKFRKHAFYLLVTLLTFVCVWFLLSRLSLFSPPTPEEAPAQGAEPGEASPGEEEIPRPPNWAVYLGALIVGLGLAIWLGPKVAASLERKHTKRAIQDVAKQAVAELELGKPVSDAVIRAWLRMVEILSTRSGMRDQPHFTPREFAETMKKLGFRHEAVEILTKLFEEVRYGHKESEARREQAITALAALEQTFT